MHGPVFATAPGRCGILGNPSDIYGGKVLSCSVPARARCTLTASDDWVLPDDTRLWDACMARYPTEEPLQVEWETAVPRSSGLSGSTALLASTLASLLAFRGEEPALDSPKALADYAELVRDIERNEANIVCGYQDAYMIVHGGLQLMDFAGKHPKIPGPNATLKPIDAALPFILVTTGVERLSGSVHGPMAERWIAGEAVVVDAIARISELAEPGSEMLERGDLGRLAALMNENQELIASVGGSGDAIDLLVSRSISHGALAAKLAGAGMGGTIIALTESPDQLERALRADGYTRFMVPSRQPGVGYVR